MVKKLIELLPENEEAILKIKREHPNLRTDVAAIRFALSYTTLNAANKEENHADLLQKLGELSRDQAILNIMMVSLMNGIKVSVEDSGDPLDSESIKKASRSLKRHLDRIARDRRHGGARDGNRSPHDQA
jgi:hypothetical protein